MRTWNPERVTMVQVAARLGLSHRTLHRWAIRGEIGPGFHEGKGLVCDWTPADIAEAKVLAALDRLGFPRSRWLRVRSQVRACLAPPSPACLFVRSDDTVHIGEPSLLPELLGSGVVWAVPL